MLLQSRFATPFDFDWPGRCPSRLLVPCLDLKVPPALSCPRSSWPVPLCLILCNPRFSFPTVPFGAFPSIPPGPQLPYNESRCPPFALDSHPPITSPKARPPRDPSADRASKSPPPGALGRGVGPAPRSHAPAVASVPLWFPPHPFLPLIHPNLHSSPPPRTTLFSIWTGAADQIVPLPDPNDPKPPLIHP